MSVRAHSDSWRSLRILLVAAVLAAGTGCSWVKSLTESDDDEDAELEPAELVDFEPEIKVREVWSTGIGNGQGLHLAPHALDHNLVILVQPQRKRFAVIDLIAHIVADHPVDLVLAGGTAEAVVKALDEARDDHLVHHYPPFAQIGRAAGQQPENQGSGDQEVDQRLFQPAPANLFDGHVRPAILSMQDCTRSARYRHVPAA